MEYHEDPLLREELIRNYLLKRLDESATKAFESHYLICDECFEELRASELLMGGLSWSKVDRRRLEDVVVIAFSGPVQLTRQSEMTGLLRGMLEQKDTKVLIDLSRVSRIDSAGLGMLINCYSHAVRNSGMLKLLNPSMEVQRLLHITHIDSVLETYYDERQAVASFNS
ncbi:MAG TPA: STAS domain-containing protein [Bryobacterales bacterium]|jgi:anti-sigma B factor antagonist|nr:STAS domain-containing protein [Bryobacterales bacterium]